MTAATRFVHCSNSITRDCCRPQQCRGRIPIWEGDSLPVDSRKLVSHTIGVSLTVGTNDAGPKKYRRQVGGIIDCRCFWLVAAFISCPTVLFCSRCLGKCVIVLNGQIILTEGGDKADISQALQNPYLHLLHLCIIHHFQLNRYNLYSIEHLLVLII